MKASLAFALAAALPALPAQDKTGAGLPQVHSAFEATKECAWAALIAVVHGSEPLILTAGSDASGKELTPLTLVPLLVLAKVLAADAIHVQLEGKIDVGSGEKLGDRELTVRELLDGVTLLPDFHVLDGGAEVVDAALLRNCGAVAAGANMQMFGTSLGAPEFVLLEPRAFSGRDKDWPTLLRSTLAPRVPGLDPTSADALGEPERGCTILAADDLTKLAAARPSLLRTLLSLKSIGSWLQWRAQQQVPLWASARMGRMSATLTQAKEQRWVTSAQALGVSLTLAQYPSRQAALLYVQPPGTTTSSRELSRVLQRAFEGDLFASGDEDAQDPAGEDRLRAALAAGRVAPASATMAASALDGTRWCTASGDGKEAVRLAFGAKAGERLTLTVGGDTVTFSMAPMGDGLRATPTRPRPDVMFHFWLRPEPNADKPTRLTGVLISQRLSGAATAALAPALASVPRYLELVPDKQ